MVAQHHPVHVALGQNLVVGAGHRHRVVIAIKPDQGQRIGPGGLFAAGVEAGCGQRHKGSLVLFQKLGLGAALAPEAAIQILAALLGQHGIELIQVLDLGNRHQEIEPGKLDHPLHHPLLIGAPHPAKMLPEKIVALQLQETIGQFTLMGAYDLGGQNLGIVVTDPVGDPAEMLECPDVALPVGLGAFLFKGRHEKGV